MKKNNRFGILGFIVLQYLFLVISVVYYRITFFRVIGTQTLDQSVKVLFFVLFGSCLLGLITAMNARRNLWSVAANTLIGFGIYTVIAYFPLRKGLILALLIIGAVISTVLAVPTLFRKIVHAEHAGRIVWRRILRALNRSKTVFACAFLVLFFALGIRAAFGEERILPTVQPSEADAVSQQTINNNIDTILLLQEDAWADLSLEEKTDVMQTVANIEQRYLGLPYPISVVASELPEDEYGNYSDREHTITLSRYCLENEPASTSLEAVLHEAYHCYQHCLVEMYDRTDAADQKLRVCTRIAVYKAEFNNYIDADTDLYGYYFQTCEEDARDYAESGVEDYYNAIEQYLHPDAAAAEAMTDDG